MKQNDRRRQKNWTADSPTECVIGFAVTGKHALNPVNI